MSLGIGPLVRDIAQLGGLLRGGRASAASPAPSTSPAPGPASVTSAPASSAHSDMLELSPSALVRFAAWLARHQPRLPGSGAAQNPAPNPVSKDETPSS
jgi:hypothetical protein